ncbi:hypothetical protein [Nonomuraea sp. NPDC049141]|uniref:hypothetical protein n=1 Tax=Nonomuraea sp. NPDC049141 TaxID=3155500 RepID=UPI0033EA6622
MNTAPHHVRIWPTVESIPVSAVTDKPPGHLGPVRAAAPADTVAGAVGTGRDTTGGDAAGHDTHATTGHDIHTTTGHGPNAPTGRPGAPTGRDTRPATGVGTAGAQPRGAGARGNSAAEMGFSGDPEQRGDPGDDMLHAQRIWDGSLAANRLDDAGVTAERQRVAIAEVTASICLIIDGWPEDVWASVESVLEYTDAHVLALDLGDVDGAGEVLHKLALRHPDRITEWRVAETPHWRGGSATWGACRAKLLRLDTSEVHVLMETSIALAGDALTPLVAAVADGAVAAGRRGAEPSPDGTEWHEAGPGPVRALRGDLMAVRRSAAIGALPEDARYGGNADLELSLALKGELVVPSDRLPVRQLRHHDVSPEYRDRESRRNHDNVLRMLSAS